MLTYYVEGLCFRASDARHHSNTLPISTMEGQCRPYSSPDWRALPAPCFCWCSLLDRFHIWLPLPLPLCPVVIARVCRNYHPSAQCSRLVASRQSKVGCQSSRQVSP